MKKKSRWMNQPLHSEEFNLNPAMAALNGGEDYELFSLFLQILTRSKIIRTFNYWSRNRR
jgi:hypothetical protein